jgi:hypothetical protein
MATGLMTNARDTAWLSQQDIYDVGVSRERNRIAIIIEHKIRQMRIDRRGANGLRIEELNNSIILFEGLLEEVKVDDE